MCKESFGGWVVVEVTIVPFGDGLKCVSLLHSPEERQRASERRRRRQHHGVVNSHGFPNRCKLKADQ